ERGKVGACKSEVGSGKSEVRSRERTARALNLELTDKIAIVTGVTRGLGFGCAAALLDEGCRVTICARGEAGLSRAVDELRRIPGADARLLAVQADVST